MTSDANRYRSTGANIENHTGPESWADRQPTARGWGHHSDGPVSNRTGKRTVSRWRVVRPAADAVVAFAVFAVLTGALSSQPSIASPITPLIALSVPAPSVPAPNGSSLAVVAIDDNAPVVQIATTTANSSNAVYRRTSDQTAILLLAMSFSILAAFNLAFFRHLRQAYARPKRRDRRQQSSPHHLSGSC